MSNKKVGGILIFASILLLGVLIAYNFQLKLQSNAIGCNPNATCMKMNSLLTLTNIFIGIISAILSLGFYFIFFNKSEQEIINKITNLEKEKRILSKNDKFNLFIKALNSEEQMVLKLIKYEEGITQSSLRHKTGLSKTKLSFILSDLEKKEIVKKELYGKTNKLYMKEAILSI